MIGHVDAARLPIRSAALQRSGGYYVLMIRFLSLP